MKILMSAVNVLSPLQVIEIIKTRLLELLLKMNHLVIVNGLAAADLVQMWNVQLQNLRVLEEAVDGFGLRVARREMY